MSHPTIDGGHCSEPYLPTEPAELLQSGDYATEVDVLIGEGREEKKRGNNKTGTFRPSEGHYRAVRRRNETRRERERKNRRVSVRADGSCSPSSFILAHRRSPPSHPRRDEAGGGPFSIFEEQREIRRRRQLGKVGTCGIAFGKVTNDVS